MDFNLPAGVPLALMICHLKHDSPSNLQERSMRPSSVQSTKINEA